MKVLNLYAGLGGNRKLWEDVGVTAIEINPKIAGVYKKYHSGDKLIIGDAHQYLLDHYKEFDFVWSSPPCQKNSKMIISGRNRRPDYADTRLYQEVIFLQTYFNGKWVVENVDPYYKPLIEPSFKIGRHLFWGNFTVSSFQGPELKSFIKRSKEDIENWLGISTNKNIYYDGNHDPIQVLRNCVHPETGLHILNCARGIINQENVSR